MEDKQLEYGHVKSNILYRNISNQENSLELKTLGEEEESEAIQFFEKQFEKFSTSFNELIEKVNSSENKGSFLVKLQNTKAKLITHKGLGDYDIIENEIISQENLIKETVLNNRARNTDIKNALMLELDEALKNNDLFEVNLAVKDIKERWIKTGRASDETFETLEASFKEKIQGFYDKRQSFYDDKAKLQAAKVKKYEVVIEQLNTIIANGQLKSEIDKVIALQAEWKSLGSIPEKDYKPLNKVYFKTCDNFFDLLKKQRKAENTLSKEDFNKNLLIKKAMVEELSLLDQKSLKENVSNDLNSLKSKWKNTGKVSKKESDIINNSFYQLNGSIMEKQFIFNLAKKKFNSFDNDDTDKQSFLIKKLTKNLLDRDKSDLAIFKENMDNMHVNKGSFVDMLEDKLKQYERKVEQKTKILESLK